MELFEDYKKSHKGWGLVLKIILAIMIISRSLGTVICLVYLLSGKVLLKLVLPNENADPGLLIFSILFNVSFVVFCIAIWKKKKWGLYAALGVLVLETLVSAFVLGFGLTFLLTQFIGYAFWMAIIYYLWSEYL
jgi:hypothetical protein